MGLFSAFIGNAGAVSQEDLKKDYGKLLISGEEIELGFKLIQRPVYFYDQKTYPYRQTRIDRKQN